MIEFARDASCKLCPLYEGCQSVCIPTRRWRPLRVFGTPFTGNECGGEFGPPLKHALLIVGEAPGYREDQSGEGFVGPSGTYLDRIYVQGMRLPYLANVYLANAARCRPPKNSNPTVTQLRLCRPYLAADLMRLQAAYDRVTILCVGAVAVKSLLGWSLKKAFGQQGHEITEIGTGKHTHELARPVHVFATYHPGILMPGRDPSKIAYIKRHLALLKTFLQTSELSKIETPDYRVNPPCFDPLPQQVALDIETCGILKGYTQTVFHPAKSAAWDECGPRQVVTVALSWWDSSGEGIESAIFDMSKKSHRLGLHWWLDRLQAAGSEVLCMNTQFDIQYLRAISMFRKVLAPPLRLWDLAVSNYLSEDSRPERSLKDVAPLYGVTRYEPGFKQYDSPQDPELWAYNVQDTHATLKTERLIQEEIARNYPGTAKQSEFTRQWYSDLLWSVIAMSEAGSTFDRAALEKLRDRLERRLNRLTITYQVAYEVPICGEGSQKGLIELFGEAIGVAGLWDHDELVFTFKTRRVSTGEANLGLLLSHLPLTNPLARQLRLLVRFKGAQKLMSSYVRPLLVGRGKHQRDKGPTLVGDRCYPSWFVVPSRFDEGTEGGTNQARITCLWKYTPIYTAEGIRSLEDVVEHGTKGVLSVSKEGDFKFRPAKAVRGGRQMLYGIDLVTRNGRRESAVATAEHRWVRHLDGSWITTAELRPGTALRHVTRSEKTGYPWLEMRWNGKRSSCSLHRAVAELIRPVLPSDHVHHRDGARRNWKLDNLRVMPSLEHRKMHGEKRKRRVSFKCQTCGEVVERRASVHRHKYCSKKCLHSSYGENWRVTGVRPLQVEEVYCLTVPPDETFVLYNGLVSGNCKGPALQTAPEPIKACFSTRFSPGFRIHADYSQLELGVAALLSGDKQFMYDFVHEDIHWRTARLVAEVLGVPDPDAWATRWRKWGGKTQNFRALFRGGAPKFQAVLRSKGIDIRLDDCKQVDAAFRGRYPRLWDWQEEQIETAKTKGYIELALVGQSRRFLGSRRTVDRTYTQTIVNLPVQATAACICESAQIEISQHLCTHNLSSVLVLNCYDALDLECPQCEREIIDRLLNRVMPSPPYYNALCAELGRNLPLTIDVEIVAEKGLPVLAT